MTVRPIALAALALAGVLAPATSGAIPVSGQVVDEQGVGIWNVDLDFFDRDLNLIIFTPNDNTDFGGFYDVDVPAGRYDITFNAPAGSPYLDVEMLRVDIDAATTIDVTLPVGNPVHGVVTAPGGAPLFDVDLNFLDLASGDILNTNDDNTDLAGAFSVLVPQGTYDILFTAPAGQPWAGLRLAQVAIADTTDLGTLVLPPGYFVSGTLTAPGGAPIATTDLDAIDPATGDPIYTPRDDTDAFGTFSVVVPSGTWNLVFKSLAGSGLAWKTMPGVAVSADLALGTVALEPGFAVTGTVRNEGGTALAGGDLDLLTVPAGLEVAMPDDNAGAGGVFSLLAAAGTYDLVAKPPVGVAVAATILRGVAISGSTNVGTVTLPTGFSVSGTVRDGAVGVGGADLDAFELGSGLPWPTPHDDTAADGTYSIRLPAGSWRLVATPPVGSGLAPATLDVDPLASDVVLDFDLGAGTVGVTPDAASTGLRLLPSAPNPFRATTRIRFELPVGARDARLTVHDLAGRVLRRLDAPVGATGRGEATWDGRDGAGSRVASGVYWVRVESGRATLAQKVTVLR